MRENNCLPVHIGFGFKMAGSGIFPFQLGSHISRFIMSSCRRGGTDTAYCDGTNHYMHSDADTPQSRPSPLLPADSHTASPTYCEDPSHSKCDEAPVSAPYPQHKAVLTLSMKVSLLVIFMTAVSESCTMPITGRLDWGVSIMAGTMQRLITSACVSRLWGTWRFISSPSKSAL